MNPTIEELHNNQEYELMAKINYQHILIFLLPHLKPSTWLMKLFYGLNLLFLTLAMLRLFHLINYQLIDWNKGMLCLLIVIVTTILLVPIHELIHGMAFKILGAGKLTFGVNSKDFIFYVTADMFVIRKTHFYFLASLPFIIISVCCVGCFVFGNPVVQLIALMVLFLHATCCIGDFALISYFLIHCQNKIAYTYDDVGIMTSYYFRKR